MSAEMKEDVARVIDPDAFERLHKSEPKMVRDRQEARKMVARNRAQIILNMVSSAPQDRDVGMSRRERALESAALDFVMKVNTGSAKSRENYKQFQAALSLPPSVAVPEGWQFVPKDFVLDLAKLLPPAPLEKDGRVITYFDPKANDTLQIIRKRFDAMLPASPSPVVDAPAQSVELAKATINEAYADYWGLSGDELPDNCAIAIADALVKAGLLKSTPTPVPADDLRKALEEISRLDQDLTVHFDDADSVLAKAQSIARAALQQPALDKTRIAIKDEAREEAAIVAETLGVYPELNVFAGGPGWYKHSQRIAAAIRSLKGHP